MMKALTRCQVVRREPDTSVPITRRVVMSKCWGQQWNYFSIQVGWDLMWFKIHLKSFNDWCTHFFSDIYMPCLWVRACCIWPNKFMDPVSASYMDLSLPITLCHLVKSMRFWCFRMDSRISAKRPTLCSRGVMVWEAVSMIQPRIFSLVE